MGVIGGPGGAQEAAPLIGQEGCDASFALLVSILL